MNTAKIYHDSNGNEKTIYQMVKEETEWAANRIQEGEKAIEKLKSINKSIDLRFYNSIISDIKSNWKNGDRMEYLAMEHMAQRIHEQFIVRKPNK